MAIRWQTFALLAVLLGVGLVALLHPRPRAQESERSEPPSYYEPTAAQAARAFAALRTPRGFARGTEHCANELCFSRRASLVLSLARMRGLLTESGLAVNVDWKPTPECSADRIGHKHFHHFSMMQCVATASLGKTVFLAQLSSLVAVRAGRFRGTSRELGKPKEGLGGTEIILSDYGVPRPLAVKYVREALRHDPEDLRGLPLLGETVERAHP